jgi:hypothetical protein
MNWLTRSVVLCVLILTLTPAPAQAWFELLDYLSGPGRWYGLKADFRIWCSGQEAPWKGLRDLVDNTVLETLKRRDVSADWTKIRGKLVDSNEVLPLFNKQDYLATLDKRMQIALSPTRESVFDPEAFLRLREFVHAQIDTFERTSASIATIGIFISFCKSDRTRSVAVELGYTTLQTNSNPDFAQDHTIRLNTITAGLSYRLPLPPDRDIVDIGFNAGLYNFSSRGFDAFSGLILEPFVDLHGPSDLINEPGLKKIGGLLTARFGLVFFPGGFDGSQFASAPSRPETIRGSEPTPSVTIFFNLAPLLWRRPPTTVWSSGNR